MKSGGWLRAATAGREQSRALEFPSGAVAAPRHPPRGAGVL